MNISIKSLALSNLISRSPLLTYSKTTKIAQISLSRFRIDRFTTQILHDFQHSAFSLRRSAFKHGNLKSPAFAFQSPYSFQAMKEYVSCTAGTYPSPQCPPGYNQTVAPDFTSASITDTLFYSISTGQTPVYGETDYVEKNMIGTCLWVATDTIEMKGCHFNQIYSVNLGSALNYCPLATWTDQAEEALDSTVDVQKCTFNHIEYFRPTPADLEKMHLLSFGGTAIYIGNRFTVGQSKDINYGTCGKIKFDTCLFRSCLTTSYWYNAALAGVVFGSGRLVDVKSINSTNNGAPLGIDEYSTSYGFSFAPSAGSALQKPDVSTFTFSQCQFLDTVAHAGAIFFYTHVSSFEGSKANINMINFKNISSRTSWRINAFPSSGVLTTTGGYGAPAFTFDTCVFIDCGYLFTTYRKFETYAKVSITVKNSVTNRPVDSLTKAPTGTEAVNFVDSYLGVTDFQGLVYNASAQLRPAVPAELTMVYPAKTNGFTASASWPVPPEFGANELSIEDGQLTSGLLAVIFGGFCLLYFIFVLYTRSVENQKFHIIGDFHDLENAGKKDDRRGGDYSMGGYDYSYYSHHGSGYSYSYSGSGKGGKKAKPKKKETQRKDNDGNNPPPPKKDKTPPRKQSIKETKKPAKKPAKKGGKGKKGGYSGYDYSGYGYSPAGYSYSGY